MEEFCNKSLYNKETLKLLVLSNSLGVFIILPN